jgi:hypothetical protein
MRTGLGFSSQFVHLLTKVKIRSLVDKCGAHSSNRTPQGHLIDENSSTCRRGRGITATETEIDGTGARAIKLGAHFQGSLTLLFNGHLLHADTMMTTPSGWVGGRWTRRAPPTHGQGRDQKIILTASTTLHYFDNSMHERYAHI